MSGTDRGGDSPKDYLAYFPNAVCSVDHVAGGKGARGGRGAVEERGSHRKSGETEGIKVGEGKGRGRKNMREEGRGRAYTLWLVRATVAGKANTV